MVSLKFPKKCHHSLLINICVTRIYCSGLLKVFFLLFIFFIGKVDSFTTELSIVLQASSCHTDSHSRNAAIK